MEMSRFKKGTVVISLDDGDADGFRLYETVFKPYRLSATYNVVTTLLDIEERLTMEQLKILHNDPLTEIAAHGHTHQNDDADVSTSAELLCRWLDIKENIIGFASPGSHMKTAFIEENADHLRSMGLLYVRTGHNTMPGERLLKLQETLKAQGAPDFVVAHCLDLSYGFDGLCINSSAIHHDTTVEEIKALVELAVAESACIVLMFHRVKKPGEKNYEGKLCYDYDSFVELAEYLAQMRDTGKIDILTTEQAYRLGQA